MSGGQRRQTTRTVHGVDLFRVARADVPTYRFQHGQRNFELWKDHTDGWVVTGYRILPPTGEHDVLGHQAGFTSLSQAVLAVLGDTLTFVPPISPAPQGA